MRWSALSKTDVMNGMDEIKIEKSGDTITMRAKVKTSDVGSQFSGTPQAGSARGRHSSRQVTHRYRHHEPRDEADERGFAQVH